MRYATGLLVISLIGTSVSGSPAIAARAQTISDPRGDVDGWTSLGKPPVPPSSIDWTSAKVRYQARGGGRWLVTIKVKDLRKTRTKKGIRTVQDVRTHVDSGERTFTVITLTSGRTYAADTSVEDVTEFTRCGRTRLTATVNLRRNTVVQSIPRACLTSGAAFEMYHSTSMASTRAKGGELVGGWEDSWTDSSGSLHLVNP